MPGALVFPLPKLPHIWEFLRHSTTPGGGVAEFEAGGGAWILLGSVPQANWEGHASFGDFGRMADLIPTLAPRLIN